jgi:transcriptional regulator with XRE-family HTH domain
MHIGEKIKRLREARHWTQQELADKAKVKQPVISRLEGKVRSHVHSGVLKKLATALGCTADYLIGMHEEEDSEHNPAAVALAGH